MDAANTDTPQELTRLIRAWQGGDLGARERLMVRVYDRVRAIAAQSIRAQGGATLSPTELAHESLLRLLGADADWADRRHFFHVIAQATRQVLVDHARRRLANKRGDGVEPITLGEAERTAMGGDAQLLQVNEAPRTGQAQNQQVPNCGCPGSPDPCFPRSARRRRIRCACDR